MEGLAHGLQFMLATDLRERASLLTTMSNDLVSSMKAKERGICCRFFWICQMEKIMSTFDPSASKPNALQASG